MSTTGAFPRSFRNCTNISWPPLPKALFTHTSAIFSALRSSSSQRTCLAMPVSWVNEVRKMLSLPFWAMMIDSDPVNCGTPAWRAMSMFATVLELYTVPKMAKGLSLSTRRMTATEVGGSVWVSCTAVSSFMPRMPPFLLMSSTARLTASRHMAPTLAPPPVISATIGSLITPWAPAITAASRLNSAARSGVADPNRRMGTSSLECVVVNTSTECRRARIALPAVEGERHGQSRSDPRRGRRRPRERRRRRSLGPPARGVALARAREPQGQSGLPADSPGGTDLGHRARPRAERDGAVHRQGPQGPPRHDRSPSALEGHGRGRHRRRRALRYPDRAHRQRAHERRAVGRALSRRERVAARILLRRPAATARRRPHSLPGARGGREGAGVGGQAGRGLGDAADQCLWSQPRRAVLLPDLRGGREDRPDPQRASP